MHLIRPAGPAARTEKKDKTTSVNEVPGGPTGHYVVPAGIHKIKHVIIIMQENRSFDSYFGTYPGADGIPMKDGKPTVCVPNPSGGCTRPYHDRADLNGGGPHGEDNAVADVNGGKMNGFIQQRDAARAVLPPGRQPGLRRDPHPGRDGVPHGRGDPQLLEVRRELTCSTTTCSSR